MVCREFREAGCVQLVLWPRQQPPLPCAVPTGNLAATSSLRCSHRKLKRKRSYTRLSHHLAAARKSFLLNQVHRALFPAFSVLYFSFARGDYLGVRVLRSAPQWCSSGYTSSVQRLTVSCAPGRLRWR